MSGADLILKPRPVTRVEIARSFAYKLNAGNFESRDFFCSEKAECSIEDAPEVSAALYAFCRSEVLKAVKEYRMQMDQRRAKGAA